MSVSVLDDTQFIILPHSE